MIENQWHFCHSKNCILLQKKFNRILYNNLQRFTKVFLHLIFLCPVSLNLQVTQKLLKWTILVKLLERWAITDILWNIIARPQLNFIGGAQCILSIAEFAPPSWLFLGLFIPECIGTSSRIATKSAKLLQCHYFLMAPEMRSNFSAIVMTKHKKIKAKQATTKTAWLGVKIWYMRSLAHFWSGGRPIQNEWYHFKKAQKKWRRNVTQVWTGPQGSMSVPPSIDPRNTLHLAVLLSTVERILQTCGGCFTIAT